METASSTVISPLPTLKAAFLNCLTSESLTPRISGEKVHWDSYHSGQHKADDLPSGQVERYLGFHFGKVFGYGYICHRHSSNHILLLAIVFTIAYNRINNRRELIHLAKSANVFARVEPELKNEAEAVLDQLGVPMSNAITMFLRQIVLKQGLPFEVSLPHRRPLVLSELTAEQWNEELNHSYQQALRGEGVSLDQAFDDLERKYGL